MESWIVILIVIGCYLLVTATVGLMAGRGRDGSLDEFVNAGRSLGPFVSYFLMGATVFSAFACLGAPGWAYGRGAAAFFILAYCSTGLWTMFFIGPAVMALGRKYGYSTQCELLGGRFQSRWVSVVVATVSILAFIQYITLQMKGSGYVFSTITGGRVSFNAGAFIAYAVVIIYVFWGGVRGVAWTNVFQGFFLLTVAWILGLYIPWKLHGGIGPMFEKIAATDPQHLLIGLPGTHISYAEFSSTIVVTFLGFCMWPSIFMRAYNLDSPRTLRRTIMLYPTFALFIVPVLFIGFAGISFVDLRALGLQDDAILPYMILNLGFPAVVVGLFGAGTLAAAMSTQDAVTHAAATIFAKDLCANLFRREFTPVAMMRLVRLAVLVFGAIAFLIAIYGGASLVRLLLGAYGSIVQIFPVVIAALFWKRATAAGVLAGFSAGVGLNFLISLRVIPTAWTLDLHAGLWGLAVNALLLITVSLRTRPQDPAHVEAFTATARNG